MHKDEGTQHGVLEGALHVMREGEGAACVHEGEGAQHSTNEGGGPSTAHMRERVPSAVHARERMPSTAHVRVSSLLLKKMCQCVKHCSNFILGKKL